MRTAGLVTAVAAGLFGVCAAGVGRDGGGWLLLLSRSGGVAATVLASVAAAVTEDLLRDMIAGESTGVIKGFVGVRAALAAATFTPRGLRTAVEAGVIGEGVTGLLTAVVVVAAGGGSRRFGISTAFTTASGDDD